MKPYTRWYDALQAAVTHPHFALVVEHLEPEIVGNAELAKALNSLLRQFDLPPFIAAIRPVDRRSTLLKRKK